MGKNIDIEMLYKAAEGGLSPAELEHIDQWLASDPARREYYERVVVEKTGEPLTGHVGRELLLANMLFLKASMTRSDRKLSGRRRRILYGGVSAAAALVGVAVFGFMTGRDGSITRSQMVVQSGIYGAEPKVSSGGITMITGQGDVLMLEDIKQLSREGNSGYMLTDDDSALYYDETGADAALPRMVTLKVARGSDFRLRLEDGSMVWINSDTEIEYQTHFAKDQRRVTVRGEAYFEVAEDRSRPFIVSTGYSEVEVLGTQFNINNRKPLKVVTTLVEGSVALRVVGSTKPEYLKPGETASLDLQTMKMNIARDDVALRIGWKTGIYKFHKARIEEVLHELSLWHDLNICYTDPALKDEVFSGSISRNESLGSWLELLGATGHITFELDSRTLTVK